MPFVFDEVGAFVRCEQIWNELVEFASGLVARQVRGLKLDQLLRDLEKEIRVSEVRFQIADQIYGCAFWNHPQVDVPVVVGESLELFPRHKLLAQMQRAVVLCTP